ncbi:putative ammonium transporter 3 isoform X1 [Lineus longissimus]|uniref:putative ammonium transporter 3 isoform X1 n=2 Tax=Lineus longissimus TaxID=88925 RepID=UPI002B4DD45D
MGGYEDLMSGDPPSDAIWILSSTFIIFTMQSGFGLLESGSVTPKNEVNIMVKNAADVIFGGFTYWIFGYAFSFGEDEPITNFFCGWGNFFVHVENETDIGWVYSKFFFQASFATTATTIVSGAMAERIKLEAYIVFSLLNTFVFCFPAHWVWGGQGWLANLGVIDIAGAGPVHLVGGVTGLISTLMLKPRHGRFDSVRAPPMGSPTNAVLGMFMLWWGWLGFNCGSTFGISGSKWKLAARSAVATITASMAGGIVGMTFSYIVKKRKFDVALMINGILGSLVGITGYCALAQPWEGFVIGSVGGLIGVTGDLLLDHLKIDDPVGVVPVHCLGGIWSLLAVGLFTRQDALRPLLKVQRTNDTGLFHGGGFRLLGVQTLAVLSISAWTIVVAFIFLKLIDLTIGLRLSLEHELLGADIVEHDIGDVIYDKQKNRIVAINGQCLDDVMDGADDHNREDVKSRTAHNSKRKTRTFSDFRTARRFTVSSNSHQNNAYSNGKLNSPASLRRFSTQSLHGDLTGRPRLRMRRGSSAYGKRINSPLNSLDFFREASIFHISDRHSGVVTIPNLTEVVTNVDERGQANRNGVSRSSINGRNGSGGVLNDSFDMEEEKTETVINEPYLVLRNGIGQNAHNPTILLNEDVEPPEAVVNLNDASTYL